MEQCLWMCYLNIAQTYAILSEEDCEWRQIYANKKMYFVNEAGNYETVIGTMKYLARLLPEKDFKNRVETFGALVSNVSAISIVKRDSFRSEAEFLEVLAEAKRNDNTLNVVKTYLKYAFMQMEAEVNPLLCKEYAADLKRYMDNVESDHLQKCFRYIRITYLETDGY